MVATYVSVQGFIEAVITRQQASLARRIQDAVDSQHRVRKQPLKATLELDQQESKKTLLHTTGHRGDDW